MKKIFFILSFIGLALFSFAQNDLVVFSEQGERFHIVIDGIKQNASPQTNVKVTGLKQPMATAKIIFEGGKIADIDQKIYFMWAGETKNGWEFTYAIVKKGEVYKIKPRSCVEIIQAQPTVGQSVVVYSVTPPPANESTTTTISTTTTSGNAPAGGNVSIDMNAGGMGVNMNVNITDPLMNGSSRSTTTTTTTTSSSGSTGHEGHNHGVGDGHGHGRDAQVTRAPKREVYILQGYNGPNNCDWPMSQQEFTGAKQSIKSKSFEDSKLTLAKQILNSNCLLSSQVKEVMMIFDFENTRLDFAKMAWGKTFDPGNYYKLNDAFTFESSIDDLNKFIEGQK